MSKAHSNEVIRSLFDDFGFFCTTDGKLFNASGIEVGFFCKTHKYRKHMFRGRKYSIHRLIWVYFNGDIPSDYEINHINGIKDDNRLENLEVVNKSNNIKHMYATRSVVRIGPQQAYNLLDDYFIHHISRNELMIKYDIVYNHVCDIIRGRRHKNLVHPIRDAYGV